MGLLDELGGLRSKATLLPLGRRGPLREGRRRAPPAFEFVVVVSVLELHRWVDVLGVDHGCAAITSGFHDVGDRRDGLFARGGLEAAFGVTETVLHVHEDDRCVIGVYFHA